MSDIKNGVSTEEAHLSDLLEDPNNTREHNPRNIGMIENSFNEVGAARSVVIDENNVLLAGNGAKQGAAQAGIEKVLIVDVDGDTLVAVRRSGLTDEQKLKLSMFDNRTAETATWNTEALYKVQQENPAVLESMFFSSELEKMFSSMQNPIAKPEPGEGGDEFDDTLIYETKCKKGDIWQIGPHRMMVGDSSDEFDVIALLDGMIMDMVWTDPPYGVGVGDKNKYLTSIKKHNRIEDNLEGDEIDEEQLKQLLLRSFSSANKYCREGGAWYVCSPPGPTHLVFGNLLNDFGILRQTIVWAKNNSTFAPLGQDYHYRHELMYYGWKTGAAHHFIGGRQQDTVWNIDRPLKSPDHPTKKPVELVLTAIENHLEPGQGHTVYDPFAGSGTTMVAAHRAVVESFLMEKDPIYADAILARAELEGIGPITKLIGGELTVQRHISIKCESCGTFNVPGSEDPFICWKCGEDLNHGESDGSGE